MENFRESCVIFITCLEPIIWCNFKYILMNIFFKTFNSKFTFQQSEFQVFVLKSNHGVLISFEPQDHKFFKKHSQHLKNDTLMEFC